VAPNRDHISPAELPPSVREGEPADRRHGRPTRVRRHAHVESGATVLGRFPANGSPADRHRHPRAQATCVRHSALALIAWLLRAVPEGIYSRLWADGAPVAAHPMWLVCRWTRALGIAQATRRSELIA